MCVEVVVVVVVGEGGVGVMEGQAVRKGGGKRAVTLKL